MKSERDEDKIIVFCDRNLRGESFRGKNFAYADFRNADLRGADFTGATLIGANFCGAKAGLQLRWKIILVVISFLVSGFSGFISALAGFWIAFQLTLDRPYVGVAFFFILLAIFLTTSKRGLVSAIAIMPLVLAVTVPIVGVVLAAYPGAPTAAGAGAGIAVLTVFGAVLVAMAATGAQVVDGAVPAIITVAGAAVGGVTATLVGNAAAIEGVRRGNSPPEAVGVGLTMVIAVTIAVTLLSIYIVWIVIPKDKNYTFIQGFAINFAVIGGTSFRKADLTEADFTRAKLKSSNFQEATIIRTRWYKARDLEWAKLDGTILKNPVVRELLVTLKLKDNKESNRFIGLDFKGANLAEAVLIDANFTKADFSDATFTGAILRKVNFSQSDLSRANFVNADLQNANLAKALALGTIFSEAKLTGICVESWIIDNTTLLEDSSCDYVWRKFTEKQPKDKYPSSTKFNPGDFAKLFNEVVNTVDLIFHNGIDQEAFIYSWQKLQIDNEGIKLDIKGIERKADDIVVVTVNVPENVNKSKIHAEFTQNYEIALKAIEEKYVTLLEAKEGEIARERQDKERLYQILAPVLNPFMRKEKVVIIDIGEGDFSTGFSVTLYIGEELTRPSFKSKGRLPANLDIVESYNQWKTSYHNRIGAFRIEVPNTQVTNVRHLDFYQECSTSAEKLKDDLNKWLEEKEFYPVSKQIFQQLNPTDSIRFILQTDNNLLRRLPWHIWSFFEEYKKAEIAISNTSYMAVDNDYFPKNILRKSSVRILAIMGSDEGINLSKDKALLEKFTENAEIVFVRVPTREELNKILWNQKWDILYFAGHSFSSTDDQVGYISTNKAENLTVNDLNYALDNAIKNGLKLAIFNSCDGLGVAFNLANLHIPQMIVMREWVPDEVAQEFLRNFLKAFVGGKSLYQSVRDAREQLHHWEKCFPCATWLPVIFQNPAEITPTWQEMPELRRN
jgi:uncharacterized protein YjbI with pentapeptide repeats